MDQNTSVCPNILIFDFQNTIMAEHVRQDISGHGNWYTVKNVQIKLLPEQEKSILNPQPEEDSGNP